MSEAEARRSGTGSESVGGEESSPGAADYAGPGAWGTWAMVLLIGLFLIAAGATVHSMIVTLGG